MDTTEMAAASSSVESATISNHPLDSLTARSSPGQCADTTTTPPAASVLAPSAISVSIGSSSSSAGGSASFPTTPTNSSSSIFGSAAAGHVPHTNMYALRSQKSSPSLPASPASAAHSISFGGSGAHTQPNRCDSPTSTSYSPMNIFSHQRTRRYSTSFSPLAGGSSAAVAAAASAASSAVAMPRLTPRVSQLRQEECADISNSREVSHERDVHTALQISQSWEDLSLDGSDGLSVRSTGSTTGGSGDGVDLSNPLHVSTFGLLGLPNCSSPSPTSRTAVRLPPYGLSPSPTRRTFATRRSMSPIAMRPSSLGSVKRKFDNDEAAQYASSPPPFKKIFQERGNSPIIGQHSSTMHNHIYASLPSPFTCPSPDSSDGTGGGRSTPKLYMSKLCSTNSSSSSSSPSTTSAPSPLMDHHLMPIDLHEPMQTDSDAKPPTNATITATAAGGNSTDTTGYQTDGTDGCTPPPSAEKCPPADVAAATHRPTMRPAELACRLNADGGSANDCTSENAMAVDADAANAAGQPLGPSESAGAETPAAI